MTEKKNIMLMVSCVILTLLSFFEFQIILKLDSKIDNLKESIKNYKPDTLKIVSKDSIQTLTDTTKAIGYNLTPVVIKPNKEQLATVTGNSQEPSRDSLRRLFKTYADSMLKNNIQATPENVSLFCKLIFTDSLHLRKRYCADWQIAYGVANKETAFRKGTARSCNNLYGFKMARRRFTWASSKGRQNNGMYLHWSYSILDFYEYSIICRKHIWSALNLKGIVK